MARNNALERIKRRAYGATSDKLSALERIKSRTQGVGGYSYYSIDKWQKDNEDAINVINGYQSKIQNGDWMSSEDRQAYKSAIDKYTTSATNLRDLNRKLGTSYTADEEKSWNDSLSSLGSSYDEIEKHYSQWRDEDDYRGIEHWLEKPSQFDDGWQFGDGFKAVAGTLSDLKTHLDAGMLGIGEGLVDALATLGPYFAQGQYYANGGGYNVQADQAFNNAIATQKAGSAEFVKKDLYDEDAIARMLPDALEPITGINIDQHSVLGGKADSVVKSSGQMLGTIALQSVGVPWWLTTGATSLGGEAENALRQGASLEEAAFSGLVSAGAEILTEKLFGGIKFVGGQTVDDVLLKPLMNSISNKTLRTIVSKGVDIAGEGLEEVFSGMLGAVGQKLSYASEQEWKNLFSSEDALDSLIGGVAMSLGLGGASAKVSDAIVNTRQGAEMQKAFGKGVGADITAQTLELNGDNKYAQKLNSKLEGGKNLSAYQTGKILGEYKSEVNNYDIGKVKAAAESRLTELGETGDVSAIADAIARETVGEELSFKDRAVLNKSTKANIVLTEMMPENIKGGNLANKWAEGIGTKRVNADVYNLSKATVTPNTESSTEAKISAPAGDVKAAIEQAAKDKVGKIDGFTEETANVMVKDYDGSVSPSEYVTTFEEAFKLGRDNAQVKELTRLSKESSVIGRALLHAYDAGLQSRNVASKATNPENSVLQNGTESAIINTESESITNEGKTGTESIRLRNSGKWLGGKNTEGQIRRMEGGAGQNPQWREGRGRPADGEAARLLDEGRGREVRVADLGILNGSKQQKVRVIDEQDYTPEIKEAVAEAEAQGLTARVFVGDDILIEEANGSISGAHAYILGKQMLIRADHEKFTSKQFARHEIGHDKIAKGQVDIKAVRKRLEETVGKEAIDSVAQAYAEAYGRTGLSADEIWEECICDSLGDMNIFTAAGLSGREGRVTDTILAEIKAVTESETKAPTQTRGSPEGKASRSIQKAKYLSYTRVGIDNVSYIKEQLQKIYGDIESGIADEIAIARGNKVFIVDSGRENGKIKMGVREILNFSDLALRDEYVRRQNDDAVSEGRVSDELSSKLKSKDDSGRKSNLRRESGSELQADKGKSEDQQGGVSGEDADQRGLTKGKASRELDSLGNELTKEQQEYFKDSKVRDKKGNLMVLYHGTTANFNTFKKGDVGFHFGTKGAARGRVGFGKNVTLKEVYLNITNPIVFDEDLGSWDADYRLTEELYDKGILTQAEAETVLLSDDKSYRRTTEASNKKLASLLVAKGYDGIAYSNTFETKNATTSYIVFNSNQAKEITNKTPTSNPDIRYSRELDLIDYVNEKADGKQYNPLTNRELLASALESVATNDAEREKLKQYKDRVDMLNRESLKLSKINEEIKELTFGKGNKNPARLKELKEEAIKTSNRINLHDKKLLSLEATKSLKDVLDREKKKTYKAAAEKGREALHRNVEGRHKSEARAKIKKLKQKFQSIIEHPTDRQYIPVDLMSAMIDVCDLIDTSTSLYKADGSINKAQQARNEQAQRLLKLKAEYDKLAKSADYAIAYEYEQEIADYIQTIMTDYANKNIADMTLAELTDLYQTMRSIEETLRDARRLIGWSDAMTVYEAGDSIIEEQAKIGEKRKQNGISKVDDSIVNLSLSPVRAVLRMAGYNEDSALYHSIREIENGTRQQKKFVMDAVKKFEGLTTGKNASTYEKAIYDPYGKELIDKNGQKFHVTKMQMMQAIMSYEREMANEELHHVSNGGFTFADIKLLGKGEIREAVSAKYAHTITLGSDVAVKFMSELANDKWAQEYMAEARRFFDETAKEAINEANMKLKHRIVATGKNYIPYEVNSDFIVREINSENDIQQVISGYGMLKDLKEGATQPLIITGLNNVLDRHIEQVGNVAALAVPIRNFNKIWNVKSTDGSTTVREKIKSNWGVGGEDLITQAVKDVQGPRKKNGSKLYKSIKSNLIGSTFLGNVSVVLKQIGSMYTATSMLNYRDPASMMANLIATKTNRDAIAAEVNKYTAVAWVRGQGLSDAEVYDLKTSRKKSKLGRAVDKLPPALNAAKWITQMDYDVALSLWKYAKEDTAKRTGLKGEELLKATADYYNDVIENTQSMSDALHRPEVQKKEELLYELVGMFKTDLYQNAGLLRVALESTVAKPSKENSRALVKAVCGTLSSMCWASLITSVMAAFRYKVDRYRDEEDDEITLDNWLEVAGGDMLEEMVGYMFPLFGSEAAGLLKAWVTGETYEFDNLTLEALNDLSKAMTSLGKLFTEGEDDPEKRLRVIKNVLVKGTSVFGVPANNVTRFLDAVRLHAKDIANGEFLTFEAGLTSPNAQRLYNAYIEGDADKINKASRLYEDQKAIDSALRKQLRENDPRLREAAIAKLNGDNATYKRLCNEVLAEGKFDRTIIIDAFAAEYNYQKNKADEEGK